MEDLVADAAETVVTVLFDGYAKMENPKLMLANCTCTLVRGKSSLTIIDTRTAWDAIDMKNELSKHNIHPDEITHVVCTHGHSDHIGCNHLFLNAKQHIVGNSISHKDSYTIHEFSKQDYPIDDCIRVIATPGHTLDSVSVIVSKSNMGHVAICGDLFECQEDIFDADVWIEAGTESKEQQLVSRVKIAQIADVIVPGHGPLFKISKEIRQKILMDAGKID